MILQNINRDLACLRKMFNKAIDWDYCTENPVSKVKLFSECEYKRERVLSDKEECRLFQEAAEHLKPILTCALNTAMRISEILNLQWKHVDLERRQITIPSSSSKTNRKRVIPINDTLVRELKRVNSSGEGHVFLYLDSKTGKNRPVKSIKTAFNRACERAGIEDLRFHDLRHTAASRLIDRGADPVAVQYILGHANLKTTEIYLHSYLQQMRKAIDRLGPKGTKQAKIGESLLHRCDISETDNSEAPLTPFITVN